MPRKSFDGFYRQLAESDPEIRQEMESALENFATNEAVPGTSVPEEFLRETIVLKTGRPVLDVKKGAAVVDIDEIESQVWKTRLKNAAPLLSRGISSVGRIELANFPGATWIGTGWVIRDDIIVTNRHVAQIFGELQGSEFIFRPGIDDAPIRPRIET